MGPALEGIIRRRILLNFRADPAAVARTLSSPLEVITQNGFAIVGICLIGLRQLRPKGFPAALGFSAENMAHRVAVRYPESDGMRDGVFVWRRETNQRSVSLLGGRLFPGVHGHARFEVEEQGGDISMRVVTKDHEADVSFAATLAAGWRPTPAFASLAETSEFFRRGDCGYSCSPRTERFDGIRLKMSEWSVSPLDVRHLEAAFFAEERFPGANIEFDSALLMQNVAHEWQVAPQLVKKRRKAEYSPA